MTSIIQYDLTRISHGMMRNGLGFMVCLTYTDESSAYAVLKLFDKKSNNPGIQLDDHDVALILLFRLLYFDK